MTDHCMMPQPSATHCKSIARSRRRPWRRRDEFPPDLPRAAAVTMGSGVGRITNGKGHKRARRRRTLARAIDQIADDLADASRAEALRAQPVDFDLPGLGQHYCVECARYFIEKGVLERHVRTKRHKNRVKELKEKPYSQAEAEAAAGMAPTDNGPGLQHLAKDPLNDGRMKE